MNTMKLEEQLVNSGTWRNLELHMNAGFVDLHLDVF